MNSAVTRRFAFAALALLSLPTSAACSSDSDGDGSGDAGSPPEGDAAFVTPNDATAQPDGGADSTGSLDSGASDAPVRDANDAATHADASDAGTSDAIDAATTHDADADPDANGAANVDAGSALVRFANMVPDLASAIDVCVTLANGAFAGPVLLAAGVPGGLAYGEMTDHLSVPIDTGSALRVVAAGSTSCATALLPDTTGLAAAGGAPVTAVVLGSTAAGSAHAPALALFPDGTRATPNGTNVRFIHAAPRSSATDFVIGAGAVAETLQSGLTFGAAVTSGFEAGPTWVEDPYGYVAVPGYESQITARRGGGDLVSFFSSDDANVTAFLAGLEGSSATPLALVRCDETAAVTNHKLSCATSTTPPSFIDMRLVHIASTETALDLCVSIFHGTTAHGPYLAQSGVAAGLGYLQMSGPLGLVPIRTQLTASFVHAGEACSASPFYSTYETFDDGQDTIAFAESFEPDGSQSSVVADTTQTTWPAPAAGNALLQYGNVDFDDDAVTDGSANVDVLGTVQGGTEAPIGTDLAPLFFDRATTVAAGTYALRVAHTGGGATLVSTSGVTFASGESSLLWYFHDTYQHGALLRCNLAAPAAGTVTSCAE